MPIDTIFPEGTDGDDGEVIDLSREEYTVGGTDSGYGPPRIIDTQNPPPSQETDRNNTETRGLSRAAKITASILAATIGGGGVGMAWMNNQISNNRQSELVDPANQMPRMPIMSINPEAQTIIKEVPSEDDFLIARGINNSKLIASEEFPEDYYSVTPIDNLGIVQLFFEKDGKFTIIPSKEGVKIGEMIYYEFVNPSDGRTMFLKYPVGSGDSSFAKLSE